MFGRNGLYGASGVAIPRRSLMSMNALLFTFCQWRGRICRVLVVSFQQLYMNWLQCMFLYV